ncbi:MAG: acyltransferase family protein [Acidimicrobiia bacterium]
MIPVVSRVAPALPGPPADEGVVVTQRSARLAYLAGVDGLRGLAVLAVIAYHVGFGWAPGGFLGVEVFFVVSGYLITGLLVGERGVGLRLPLWRFWARRARRLLPALGVLLVAVTGYASVVVPDELPRLRGDLLGALAYSSNWHLIAGGGDYFETIGRPSILQHLWSLAVEEQFYLLWPVVLAFVLPRLGRRGTSLLVVMAATLSSAAMWWASMAGDTSRAYYATDTRASALLVGSVLALLQPPATVRIGASERKPAGTGTAPRRRLDALDLAGAAALVWLAVVMATVSQFDRGLYAGGFLRVSLPTVVVLAAVGRRRSILGRVLGNPLLRSVGLRSYSLYLWHWPVVVLTRPNLDVSLDGPTLVALRVGLTFALAEACYRGVERPIRAGTFLARARAWPEGWPVAERRRLWRLGAVAAAVLVAGLVALPFRAEHKPTDIEVLLAASPPVTVPTPTTGTATTPTTATAPDTAPATPPPGPVPTDAPAPSTPPTETVVDPTAGATTTPPTETTASPAAVPTPAVPAPPGPGPTPGGVLGIGDSVMLGASNALSAQYTGDIAIDAQVSRQVADGIDALQAWIDSGAPGTVVVDLGTNGAFYPDQLDQLVALAGPERTVVFLTVHVPQAWQDQVNTTVVEGVARHPNARLVDWAAMVDADPSLVGGDGTHTTVAGAATYAAAVKTATG